jgi:DNA gyrase subunit A
MRATASNPCTAGVLFAMHELNNDWNRPYKKSARIVGDVIGKYHPHGDQSVYDTIVRMAQDFSMRHMLVDGQGNFGSVDGDNAAAMRYTEIRLAKIAHEMLADIDKETVDFGPNYDGSEKSRWCCLRACRTCWSTARAALRWAWPPTSRRTT